MFTHSIPTLVDFSDLSIGSSISSIPNIKSKDAGF